MKFNIVKNKQYINIYNDETNKWIYCKLSPNKKSGYVTYSLRDIHNYKLRKTFIIHRLVAISFLEQPKDKNKKFITHLDFNKANNHFRNLKWVDAKELVEHNKNNPRVIKAKKQNT